MASYCLTGTVTVWDHEKVLETDNSYDCTAMWMYLMLSNGTNKISKMLSFMLWVFYNKKIDSLKKNQHNVHGMLSFA